MIVRHRMQYFPEGGGAIGPVKPLASIPGATGYAADAGEVTRTIGGAVPGATTLTGGAARASGGAAASTCGSVKPHFEQKRAPSSPNVPQWRQTGTFGGKVNAVYHRQVSR